VRSRRGAGWRGCQQAGTQGVWGALFPLSPARNLHLPGRPRQLRRPSALPATAKKELRLPTPACAPRLEPCALKGSPRDLRHVLTHAMSAAASFGQRSALRHFPTGCRIMTGVLPGRRPRVKSNGLNCPYACHTPRCPATRAQRGRRRTGPPVTPGAASEPGPYPHSCVKSCCAFPAPMEHPPRTPAAATGSCRHQTGDTPTPP
jgi:hypothetical protein